MDFTAAAAASRTGSSVSTKAPSEDFSSNVSILFSTSWRTLWRSVEIAERRACAFRTTERSQRQARVNSLFTLESVSTPSRSRSSWTFPSSKSCSIFRAASKRTDAFGLDNPKRASVVCRARRKWLFVPILVRLSRDAGPALFRG